MSVEETYKVHQNLGKLYYRKADFQKAIECYVKALEIYDRDYKVYYDLASAYVAIKEYQNAVENFKKALSLNEEDVYTLNSLACTYITMGDLDAAAEIAFIMETKDTFLANKLLHQIEKHHS